MDYEVEIIKLEKVGDSYTGNYIGISKQKNGNFLLVFKGHDNNGVPVRDAISISENMKMLLRDANKKKDLILDCEIKIVLKKIVDLKTEGHTYKKYEFTFGNGRIYQEDELNLLAQKEINSLLE